MSNIITNYHSDVRYFHFLKTYELFSNLHVSYSIEPFNHCD